MRILALVQLIVDVAHGLRLAAAEHHLKINWRKRLILKSMDPARRTGDALPWTEPRRDPLAALVLHKNVEIPLQHEKTLLDLVGVRGVALARLAIDDRQGEIAGRDHRGIVVLAGGAGADKAMLCAPKPFDFGIGEGSPIGLLVPEAADIFLHDVFERNALEFFWARMPCHAHELAPSKRIASRVKPRHFAMHAQP